MTRQVNPRTVALITKYEGCRLTAYKDPSGVWTIGFGHTGPDVHEGDTITEERATELLRADLAQFEAVVEAETRDIPTTDDQFGAMVSLAYNIGAEAFRDSSVLRLHRAGDTKGAADAFLLWNKIRSNGTFVVVPGLTRRRMEERALYLSEDDMEVVSDPVPPAAAKPPVNAAHVGVASAGVTMLAQVLVGQFHMDPSVAVNLSGLVFMAAAAILKAVQHYMPGDNHA
jgi:lysozyme